MLDILVRFFKRVAILLPGIAVAYFVTTDVYPFLNRNVPFALAVLATYVIAAYVLIPALMRLVRLFFRPKHIPLYCTTPDGFASDPINIGIEGTQQEVKKAMSAAGWFLADKRTPKNMLKMGLALLLKRSYSTAPFSHLYLLGRAEDIGFQLPLDNSPRHRHHVRFWTSTPKLSKKQDAHIKFWEKHSAQKRSDKKQLWLGAASFDTGLGVIRHSGQITHMIHPDTDAERDLIVKHLKDAGQVKKTRQITIGQPYSLRNRVLRGKLNADGKMTIITLDVRH